MSLNTKNLNFPNRSRMIDKLYSYNNFQKTQNDSTIFKKEKSPTLIPYIPSKYKIYSLTSGDRIYRFEATPPINLATLRSRIGRHISRSDRGLSLSLSLSIGNPPAEEEKEREGEEEEVAGRFQEEKSQYGHWSIRFPLSLSLQICYGDIEEEGRGFGPDTEEAC